MCFPQDSDRLEKVAFSLLYNFHREQILLNLKTYREKLVLET